ncbi:MAG: bifunctional DNA-formamidopyrimidine glycosylase/DNA-(apurinic or apyrimidinic site) lyase [Alphaproteobacteria bacterium]|nr:MAG: bifunctional DNA-formamidopyrimidine glycosylase/DNA-(apurinic or apyrimidinic site) lyase [Alphaproteobacteria bacterium]
MPELPEVETVRRAIAPVLEGRRIRAALVRGTGLRHPFPRDLGQSLTGRRVEGVMRRAKYLLAGIEGGATLLVHLGMSGTIRILPADGKAAGIAMGRHDHFALQMNDGSGIVLRDPRRFGQLDLLAPGAMETDPRLALLGPEPFDPEIDGQWLWTRIHRSRAGIKALLMDQRLIAGLGNIYALEALHLARIRPTRRGCRVSRAEATRLLEAVRHVLGEAIAAGGSSIRDHRRPDGALGYFQQTLRVYGRAGASCLRPGCTGTIRRTVQAGRSSFHCPACQR